MTMALVGRFQWESDPLKVIPDEARVRAALVAALALCAEDVKRAAQARMKANFDITQEGSGSFYDSLEIEMDAASLKATVGSAHPGSRLQEFGGTIRPVAAQALHWVEGGQDVFAQQATIPARPYLGPGLQDAEPEMIAHIAQSLALAGVTL